MTLSDARTTTVWAYPAGTTEGIPLNPGGSSVTYTHFTSLMEGLSSLHSMVWSRMVCLYPFLVNHYKRPN